MARRNIDITKLPSNNRKRNQPNADVGGVELAGEVSSRPSKRGGGFSSEIRSIALHLFEDVIVPSLKSTVTDFVSNGLDMFFWGSSLTRQGRDRRTDYHGAFSSSRRRKREPNYRRRQPSYVSPGQSIDDLVFTKRPDAERTLARMYELIADYGYVTVGDLYSMVGWTTTRTNENYGWETLRSVRIIRHSDGYVIDLPEPGYRE